MKFKNKITGEIRECSPKLLNASKVSAQNRKRLFWVGKLVGDKYEQVAITQPEDRGILLRDILQLANEINPKFFISYNPDTGKNEFDKEEFVLRNKSKTIRTSGRGSGINDKHNWDTIRIGQIGKGGQGDRIYSPEGKSVNLSANGGGRGAKTGLYLIQTARGKNKGGKKALNGKTPTLSSSSWEHNNKLVDRGVVRKLTPIECERLQSLPDNYTEGISNSQRYKCLGNGMNVEVIKHILTFLV